MNRSPAWYRKRGDLGAALASVAWYMPDNRKEAGCVTAVGWVDRVGLCKGGNCGDFAVEKPFTDECQYDNMASGMIGRVLREAKLTLRQLWKELRRISDPVLIGIAVFILLILCLVVYHVLKNWGWF